MGGRKVSHPSRPDTEAVAVDRPGRRVCELVMHGPTYANAIVLPCASTVLSSALILEFTPCSM